MTKLQKYHDLSPFVAKQGTKTGLPVDHIKYDAKTKTLIASEGHIAVVLPVSPECDAPSGLIPAARLKTAAEKKQALSAKDDQLALNKRLVKPNHDAEVSRYPNLLAAFSGEEPDVVVSLSMETLGPLVEYIKKHGKEDALDGPWWPREDDHVRVRPEQACGLEHSTSSRAPGRRVRAGEPIGQKRTPPPGRRHLASEPNRVVRRERDVRRPRLDDERLARCDAVVDPFRPDHEVSVTDDEPFDGAGVVVRRRRVEVRGPPLLADQGLVVGRLLVEDDPHAGGRVVDLGRRGRHGGRSLRRSPSDVSDVAHVVSEASHLSVIEFPDVHDGCLEAFARLRVGPPVCHERDDRPVVGHEAVRFDDELRELVAESREHVCPDRLGTAIRPLVRPAVGFDPLDVVRERGDDVVEVATADGVVHASNDIDVGSVRHAFVVERRTDDTS